MYAFGCEVFGSWFDLGFGCFFTCDAFVSCFIHILLHLCIFFMNVAYVCFEHWWLIFSICLPLFSALLIPCSLRSYTCLNTLTDGIHLIMIFAFVIDIKGDGSNSDLIAHYICWHRNFLQPNVFQLCNSALDFLI
jgi:hypothetical protein